MTITREQLLKQPASVEAIIIDPGGFVKIRKLTQGEVEKCRTEYGKPAQAGEAARYVVCCAVVDDHGKRLLRDEDAAALLDVDHAFVRRLAERIVKFSGLKLGFPDETLAAATPDHDAAKA